MIHRTEIHRTRLRDPQNASAGGARNNEIRLGSGSADLSRARTSRSVPRGNRRMHFDATGMKLDAMLDAFSSILFFN